METGDSTAKTNRKEGDSCFLYTARIERGIIKIILMQSVKQRGTKWHRNREKY